MGRNNVPPTFHLCFLLIHPNLDWNRKESLFLGNNRFERVLSRIISELRRIAETIHNLNAVENRVPIQ